MRLLLPLLVLAALTLGCPGPQTTDAGTEVDAGQPPTPCAAPEGCRQAGVTGVCRQGLCRDDVPCADDLECGLGERCQQGQCRFTGCVSDDDCPTGRCLLDSFTCAECGGPADCPPERPVCDPVTNACKQCLSDAECPRPGPPYCDSAGACVHCLADDQCPNGLTCTAGTCVGVGPSRPCPDGTACAAGLACVQIGGNPICLPSCKLYQQMCAANEWCYRLSYGTAGSFVFEDDGPIGVCFAQQAGLKGLNESCVVTMTGSSCEPNLFCVPETSRVSLCRQFCNPFASGTCPTNQVCTAFPGDYNGHSYGVCLPDTGFGQRCTNDDGCRPDAGLSCQPWEDPSNFNDLSPFCQFDVGAKDGLSPCGPQALADGGVLSADLGCRSGRCVIDPLYPTTGAQFCYAACATDSDCSVGGRTGVCNGQFDFTLQSGTFGYINGCRPGCTSTESCGEYDAGVVCRLQLTTGSSGRFAQLCLPPAAGALRAGEACTSNTQCASSLCQVEDSRGLSHPGLCVEACSTQAQCPAADGGVTPTQC